MFRKKITTERIKELAIMIDICFINSINTTIDDTPRN